MVHPVKRSAAIASAGRPAAAVRVLPMPAMIGYAAVLGKAGWVRSTCTDEDQDEDSEDAGGALFRFQVGRLWHRALARRSHIGASPGSGCGSSSGGCRLRAFTIRIP